MDAAGDWPPAVPWPMVALASMSSALAEAFRVTTHVFQNQSFLHTSAILLHQQQARTLPTSLFLNREEINLVSALFAGQGIGWMAASQ